MRKVIGVLGLVASLPIWLYVLRSFGTGFISLVRDRTTYGMTYGLTTLFVAVLLALLHSSSSVGVSEFSRDHERKLYVPIASSTYFTTVHFLPKGYSRQLQSLDTLEVLFVQR